MELRVLRITSLLVVVLALAACRPRVAGTTREDGGPDPDTLSVPAPAAAGARVTTRADGGPDPDTLSMSATESGGTAGIYRAPHDDRVGLPGRTLRLLGSGRARWSTEGTGARVRVAPAGTWTAGEAGLIVVVFPPGRPGGTADTLVLEPAGDHLELLRATGALAGLSPGRAR